jgi:POT family proton-dependent oligopeptide transporter
MAGLHASNRIVPVVPHCTFDLFQSDPLPAGPSVPGVSPQPRQMYKQMKATGFLDAPKLNKGDLPSWMTFDDMWIDGVEKGLSASKALVFAVCSRFLLGSRNVFHVSGSTHNKISNNWRPALPRWPTCGVPDDV